MTPGSPPRLPSISEEEDQTNEGGPSTVATVGRQGGSSGTTSGTPVRYNADERKITKGRIIPVTSGVSLADKIPSRVKESHGQLDRSYSPPSPYTLSSSPSPSSSPPPSPSQPRQERKRRKIDHGPSEATPTSDSIGPNPHWRDVATPTTPRRRTESPAKTFPTTPDSGSRYRRVLVPSQVSQGESSLPTRSPGSLMERFEATYRSLKSKPAGYLAEGGAKLPDSTDHVSLEPVGPEEAEDEHLLASVYSPVAAERRRGHTRVLTRAPGCPHITVTGGDGRRVFLRLRSKDKDGMEVRTVCLCLE